LALTIGALIVFPLSLRAVKPRCVFFFFRDTNLTGTMWRLAGLYGRDLDWVATEREPELDRLVAARTRGIWASAYSAGVGSDLSAAASPNFTRDLPTSVLRLILDLAEREGLHICFVRVQRRPENGQAPAQSPALRRYVSDLAAYVRSRGALVSRRHRGSRDDVGSLC